VEKDQISVPAARIKMGREGSMGIGGWTRMEAAGCWGMLVAAVVVTWKEGIENVGQYGGTRV
jgi:hypothetical protein